MTGPQLQVFLVSRWADAAPATWNRQLATLRSFAAWCTRQGWLHQNPTTGLDRRPQLPDNSRSIPYFALERLWRRVDIPLREKTLWRLAYETAARANELLSLDVQDLDLPNKRALVVSKGGARDLIHFQTGAAQLLPRLLNGRSGGPVFLSERRPTRAVATVDLCPETGRARLSYRRAAELFSALSGGWTLHQLRHSAITHLAEDNTALPLLMAKSRHASLRTLQRYARPGPEAVAKLTADHDPARRRNPS